MRPTIRAKLSLLIGVLLLCSNAMMVGVAVRYLGVSASDALGLAFGVGVVALLVSFIAGYFYSETMTAPIQDVVAAARRIGAGDFQARIDVRGSDELAALSRSFNEMARGLEERERVKETFRRFHGSEISRELMSNGPRLGGEIRHAVILFVDIREFTTLSERMTPDAVIEMLNEYFTRMVAIIGRHGGVVDKYIGDAIMALWGLPQPDPDGARRAVHCCLEMRAEMERLNHTRRGRGESSLRIGMGLNAGEVLAGNIGSEKRMEYTVLGDPVNVASRLQTATKGLATDLLISNAIYERIRGEFLVQPCDRVKLRGRTGFVQVFRVMGYVDVAGKEIFLPEPNSPKAA